MSRQVADHSHIQQSVTIVHTSRVFEWRSSRVFAMQHDLFDHLQNFQPPQGGGGEERHRKRNEKLRQEGKHSYEVLHNLQNQSISATIVQRNLAIPKASKHSHLSWTLTRYFSRRMVILLLVWGPRLLCGKGVHQFIWS